MPTFDRSKDVSTALSEVRTVLNRAKSAIDKLDTPYAGDDWWDGVPWDRPNNVTNEEWRASHEAWSSEHRINYADPDHDEMRAALEKVVELLEPWKKAGARRRR